LRWALPAACALAALVAPHGAQAKGCSPPKYPGNGYFTSLTVKRTDCATGERVMLAHYDCRTENGRRGRCHRRVAGYRCHERRIAIPTEFDARVKCRKGARRVVFTYQQNT
jgi:hypothetical protein